MRKTRVYIASPYSLGDRSKNVRDNVQMADMLMEFGFAPYAPLLNHFADLMFPRSYDNWLDLDLNWLRVSDVMLRMPGPSKGADVEQLAAEKWGIPVVYSFPELLDLHPAERE